jgi:hypothetical protein
MPVTTTNLIMGPADLYTAPFGSTEPLDTAIATAPTTPWVATGGTMDGVNMTVDQKYTNLEVDQVVDVVGRRLTSRDITVETNMAEPTLDNFQLALNGGTITTSGSVKGFEPNYATSATQPTYVAVIVDGYAPNSKRRRIVVRKALSTEKVGLAYQKDKQSVFTVTFGAHYVTSSIAPIRVSDDVSP